MEPLQYLALAGSQRAQRALTALPNAPVVAYVERPERARRARGAVAGAFYQLGDAVAPRPVAQAAAGVCAD